MSTSDNNLDKIFGTESSGNTAEERAKSSKVIFVRSQDELSIYREGAQGRQLSAWEALKTFGLDILEEAFFEGSAVLVDSKEEPAATFKMRREALGLNVQDISKALQFSENRINSIENPTKRNPIRDLEFLAQFLGLDERKITFQKGLTGDNSLALRLKTLKDAIVLNPQTVISFSEAAWIISVENRLREWLNLLGDKTISRQFTPNAEYGDASHRAWRIGYELAEKARTILKFSQEEPIENLRELCIGKLALPLIQCELPDYIAGATISNNESRGIVVNIKGTNENVWIRRATIAHELGHLLWDPDQKLDRIRVDKYDELDRGWSSEKEMDYIEQRANAFAAEFLAPKEVAAEIYKKDNLRAVMEKFGVSFTLARYQVWNGLHRTEDLESLVVDNVEPTDEWKGRESFTVEYFPIETVSISRTGFFAGLIVLAEQKSLISKDTAIQYLGCEEAEYDENKNVIRELFNLS